MLGWLKTLFRPNDPPRQKDWPQYWIPPRGGLYSAPDDAPLNPPIPETRSGLSPLPK